jgi:outer membrane protein insertion porin family
MKTSNVLLTLIFAVLFGGCTGLKYLPDGEKLYTGATIEFIKEGEIPKTKDLKKEVAQVITPEPNRTFLGVFRPKLWFYEVTDTPKGKGLRYFFKNKIGEPPVLLKKVSPVAVSSLISNRLDNNGYFRSKVSYEIKEKGKTAKVIYTAVLFPPYRIDSVKFPPRINSVNSKILEDTAKTLLKPGDLYNLTTIKAERERIDLYLKNEGFFYFNPDYLVCYADTAIGNRQVNLSLEVKEETPPKALERYLMHDVVIHPKYSLDNDTSFANQDTVIIDGKYYINSDSTFNPKAIANSVFFERNTYYSRLNHDITLRRLMGLGIFKFVNVKFTDEVVNDTSFLNASIYLTPLRKKSLRAEILAITKSTNFAGPGIDLSFRNRNLLKGSELFVLSTQAGLETQISGQQPGQPSLGAFNLSVEAKLYVPKFLIPFYNVSKISSYFIPKTKFELSAERNYRVDYYTMNSLEFTYGYYWQESETKLHELDPVAINYVRTSQTTPLFDSLLEINPFLQKNFQNQFILGLQYRYTFNNQVKSHLKNQYYFRGTADFSGNLMSLLNNAFSSKNVNPEDPAMLFNTPYSQYSRFEIDARYFHVFDKKNKIATRLITGVGVPYGNSDALPYIKQFFIGGSNSIRAFRARTLGPGTYPPPSPDSLSFFEQAGDIKLEMNAEYRFNIISVIKGAVFVDAGNVWLLQNDPLRPGGLFEVKDFMNELAFGTGLGLRADVNFFVIRLDLAFPIRKPWLEPGDRWVFDQINFGSPGWRKENLVLNIAIGYPF